MNSMEPVTELKSRSSQLIQQTHETQQPIIITQNGRATAVLMDIQAYERQRKVLHLLKILAQGDQVYLHGRYIRHSAAQQHFQRKLEGMQSHA
ncbi:MAG: type II toxin-antitoxin system Phd/YefM family antitoxin [bacterium]